MTQIASASWEILIRKVTFNIFQKNKFFFINSGGSDNSNSSFKIKAIKWGKDQHQAQGILACI